MLKKEEIYVTVESKEQAEMFRKVLEAMGEPISEGYYPYSKSCKSLKINIKGEWMLMFKGCNLKKITFGELIDLLQRKPGFILLI